MDVANDLARNGPSGWYSHAWMSRALQSLTSTKPNTWSRNPAVGTGLPSADGMPTTKPTSASTSSLTVGPNTGPSSPRRCPQGRTIGVPDGTTVPARPWYPIGRGSQFGGNGSEPGRKIWLTFVAWSREE